MAGWICQTRKILSTVISSLAGDLEQTAQDLNEAIHRLNSTNEHSTSAIGQRQMHEPTEGAPREKCMTSSSSQTSLTQHKGQDCSSTRHYSSALTRQPETCGSPCALNVKLSPFSPTLQTSEAHLPTSTDLELTDSNRTIMSEACMVSTSSLPCCLPSPCLMYSQSSHAQTADHEHISDQTFLSRGHHSKSLTTYQSIQPSPQSQHTCLCCKQHSLQMVNHHPGMKLPGKVVRTYTLTKEGLKTSKKLPLEISDQEIIKAGTNVPNAGTGRKHQESADLDSSSPMVIERKTHLLDWTTLWPLSSVLSFAVAQLTSLVHLLTDEHHNFQTLTSQEILLPTFPRKNVKASETPIIGQGQSLARTLSVAVDACAPGKDVCISSSSLHARTYSTESFVVIESPSFYSVPQEQSGVGQNEDNELDFLPNTRSDKCVGREIKLLELPSCLLQSGHHPSVDCGHVTEIISSSAEWVSFDVGKLIWDRHLDAESLIIERSSELGQRAQGDVRSWQVVLEGKVSEKTCRSCRGNHDFGITRCDEDDNDSDDDDDDDDSSISIIVLSDIDDSDDEFIFY